MKQQNVTTQQIIQIMEIVTSGLATNKAGLGVGTQERNTVEEDERWSRRYADPKHKQFIESLLSKVFNCDGKALMDLPEWQNIEKRLFEHAMK